jgi:hypothetical protein
MAKRNYNKRGRTGWHSRSIKKHLIVSPVCPRRITARFWQTPGICDRHSDETFLSCRKPPYCPPTAHNLAYHRERKLAYSGLAWCLLISSKMETYAAIKAVN